MFVFGVGECDNSDDKEKQADFHLGDLRAAVTEETAGFGRQNSSRFDCVVCKLPHSAKTSAKTFRNHRRL